MRCKAVDAHGLNKFHQTWESLPSPFSAWQRSLQYTKCFSPIKSAEAIAPVCIHSPHAKSIQWTFEDKNCAGWPCLPMKTTCSPLVNLKRGRGQPECAYGYIYAGLSLIISNYPWPSWFPITWRKCMHVGLLNTRALRGMVSRHSPGAPSIWYMQMFVQSKTSAHPL